MLIGGGTNKNKYEYTKKTFMLAITKHYLSSMYSNRQKLFFSKQSTPGIRNLKRILNTKVYFLRSAINTHHYKKVTYHTNPRRSVDFAASFYSHFDDGYTGIGGHCFHFSLYAIGCRTRCDYRKCLVKVGL